LRRALIAAVVTTTLASGGVAALADPGPNGHNDYGLCKAYFAGSETGQQHRHAAPPFVALEAAAAAADQTVEEWCADKTPGGK
jgi:hypothetical protein